MSYQTKTRRDYRNKAGEKLPGVTTVNGAPVNEVQGMVYVAHRFAYDPYLTARNLLCQWISHGTEDVPTDLILNTQCFLKVPIENADYKFQWYDRMQAGTVAHDMIECWFKCKKFDPSKYEEKLIKMAEPAFAAFMEWVSNSSIEIVDTEVELVSEDLQVGGTIDAVARDGQGRLIIPDWKTSKSLRREYLIQIATYGHIWNENFPDDPITGGYHLLRISKPENPDEVETHVPSFHHHHWKELPGCVEAFRHLKALFDINKKIKNLL